MYIQGCQWVEPKCGLAGCTSSLLGEIACFWNSWLNLGKVERAYVGLSTNRVETWSFRSTGVKLSRAFFDACRAEQKVGQKIEETCAFDSSLTDLSRLDFFNNNIASSYVHVAYNRRLQLRCCLKRKLTCCLKRQHTQWLLFFPFLLIMSWLDEPYGLAWLELTSKWARPESQAEPRSS